MMSVMAVHDLTPVECDYLIIVGADHDALG